MTEIHRVIGLDLSLTGTGITELELEAGGTKDEPTLAWNGKWHCAKIATSADDCLARRLHLFWEALRPKFYQNHIHMGTAYPVALVGIENYAFGKSDVSPDSGESHSRPFLLASQGGLVRVELYRANIPFLEVAIPQVKKYVCNNGGAKKSSVLLNLFRRFDIEIPNDDEDIADSFGVALVAAAYHIHHVTGKFPVGVPQADVVKALIANRPDPYTHTLRNLVMLTR